MADSVIGLFNAEVICARRPWRGLEPVEYGNLQWVDWFNNRRLPEPIGHVPPREFEQKYYRQQTRQAMAA
jgi:transposase InsO family protein